MWTTWYIYVYNMVDTYQLGLDCIPHEVTAAMFPVFDACESRGWSGDDDEDDGFYSVFCFYTFRREV